MAAAGDTLVEVFLSRAAQTPDAVAGRANDGQGWRTTTFAELAEQARAAAGGLIDLGVQKGDNVALLSGNRPEWVQADAATMLAGAVTVPIYSTNSPDQVAYILDHCGAKVAFVENRDQLDKVIRTKDRLGKLERVVMFEEPGGVEDWVSTLDQLKSSGAGRQTDVDQRARSVGPDDLATVVYTSGTTGAPKGAMLTHAGFVFALRRSGEVLELQEASERVLSYLPLSHIFERLNSAWGGICFGMEVWYAQSVDKLLDNLKECEPTFFIGVPRVFEKFHAGMKTKIEAHEKRHLIEKSIALGLEKMDLEQAGGKVPLGLRLRCALFDKLVLSKLREGIGMGNVRVAVTGGAPIDNEIMRFIRAVGLDLVEGYGQTETNAPTAITPPGKVRLGAVGPPIPGLEVRFDEDGEILVRGPNVFKGYYKDEASTTEALTEDGFLRTGDVGTLDEAGYIRITDRKKDLIKTAGGKYIAPQAIESKLKLDPLIGQAIVIGERRPFPSALLTLDEEAASKWAEERNIAFVGPEQLAADAKVLEAVGATVDRVNEALSHSEQIKKWKLLPKDFTQEDEEITPTLKVRRNTITKKYADEIEAMYSG